MEKVAEEQLTPALPQRGDASGTAARAVARRRPSDDAQAASLRNRTAASPAPAHTAGISETMALRGLYLVTRDGAIAPCRIRVTLAGSWATLSGTLDTAAQREAAEAYVLASDDILGVCNEITIR